jgi:hypothetical protein
MRIGRANRQPSNFALLSHFCRTRAIVLRYNQAVGSTTKTIGRISKAVSAFGRAVETILLLSVFALRAKNRQQRIVKHLAAAGYTSL